MDLSNDPLKALKEALAGPTDDYVVTVESRDRGLLKELWTLQGEGVEVSERLLKAGHDPGLVWIVLRDTGVAAAAAKGLTSAASDALTIIERVLKMVQSHTKGDKTKAKTKIRSGKNPVEIRKLVQQFAKDVDALVDVTDSDHEDETDDPEEA